MKLRLAAILAAFLSCAGCSTSPLLNTTVPTTSSGTGTDTFSSFLSVGGSSTHTFTVFQAGTITVNLSVVTPAAAVGLGLGTPNDAGGCTLTTALDTLAAPDPQITVPGVPGHYCVQVYDRGYLGDVPVTFSVTITHT
jgi:hypothetical protein